MNSESLEEFGDRLVELLPRLMMEITRYEHNYVTAGKITIPQLLMLEHLSHLKESKMNELAVEINVSFSAATGMIDRLLEQKLVNRKRGEHDRRTVLVSITAKGKRIVDEVYAQKRDGIIELFSHLTSEERSQYIRILEKLVQNLSSVKKGRVTNDHDR